VRDDLTNEPIAAHIMHPTTMRQSFQIVNL
jgi:hypothetical protein